MVYFVVKNWYEIFVFKILKMQLLLFQHNSYSKLFNNKKFKILKLLYFYDMQGQGEYFKTQKVESK